MTAQLHPPLFTPDQATILLDQVVYEQVLECIDLDGLYRLEQSLTILVAELDGIPDDRAGDLAKIMLDRAILRLPDDMRNYLRTAGCSPFELCRLHEAEETHPGEPPPPPRAAAQAKG